MFEGKFFANRYKILKKIDSGGMANIYLAEDTTLSRKVALKILFPQLASDSNFIERFKREAKSMSNLSHPNIATVYDWGKEEETYYIAMEYLSGHSLSQVINRKGIIPPKKVIEISIKICEALEAIHKKGIIHRDIKPSNILVTKTDDIKITDFGIVKDSAPGLTETGSILGTALYISPEQAKGVLVKKTSDIYSLGVAMYEMLTGDPPFRGDDSLSVALKHIREKPILPSKLIRNLSKNLETVVMKCLSKNPEDRYSSVVQLKEDLRKCAEGLPVLELQKTVRTKIYFKTKTLFTKSLKTLKNIKGIRIIYILTVVFLIMILSLALSQLFSTIKKPVPKPKVVVPYLEQFELSKAKEELEKIGLKTEISKQIYNDVVAKGFVISQEPEAGSKIAEGEKVYLVISLGPKVTEVPNIIGLKIEDAEKILEESNLKIGIKDEKYSEVSRDKIISQSPEPGEIANFNTSVNIVISLGVEKIEVPYVIEMSYQDARDILEDRQLSVARIYEISETIEVGTVISQEPAEGMQVFKNSLVTITISSGSEMISIPRVIRENFENAISILEELGFVVEKQWVPSSQTTRNLVLNQDPQGGTGAPPGTNIILYIGSGSP